MSNACRAICPICRRPHDGRGFCESCRQMKARQYQQTRTDKDSQRWYQSREWKQLRAAVIQRDKFCQHCKVEAIHTVDHIVARKQSNDDSMSNLQGLCKRCNAIKSNKERVGA